jgi:hypothetical protein
MGKINRVFRLTEVLAKRLKGRGCYKEKCSNCGEPFKVGDYVVSKFSKAYKTRSVSRKWYCYNCAKKLNIIGDEK